MPIDIKCPSCKAAFAVPERLDGKLIRCKTCRAEFRVGGNRPPAGDVDDYGEPVRRRPRESQSSSALPIIFAVVGVLVVGGLAVVGVGVWMYMAAEAPRNAGPAPWAEPKVVAPRPPVPRGETKVLPPAAPQMVPNYTLTSMPANAFGRPEQPTDGAKVATLSNPRKGPDFANEPTYQVDSQWQGDPPSLRDRYHFYAVADGRVCEAILSAARGSPSGTVTFRFFTGSTPRGKFDLWIARQKPTRGTWEYTRVSNVLTFE